MRRTRPGCCITTLGRGSRVNAKVSHAMPAVTRSLSWRLAMSRAARRTSSRRSKASAGRSPGAEWPGSAWSSVRTVPVRSPQRMTNAGSTCGTRYSPAPSAIGQSTSIGSSSRTPIALAPRCARSSTISATREGWSRARFFVHFRFSATRSPGSVTWRRDERCAESRIVDIAEVGESDELPLLGRSWFGLGFSQAGRLRLLRSFASGSRLGRGNRLSPTLTALRLRRRRAADSWLWTTRCVSGRQFGRRSHRCVRAQSRHRLALRFPAGVPLLTRMIAGPSF